MSGTLVAAAFFALAIAAGRSRRFQGFAFALWVLAFVSSAMAHPWLFREWGGRPLAGLVPVLIQVIMFGMGTTLGPADFARVARMPKPAILGTVLHYLVMPGLAALLARGFGFDGPLAAGVILIGAAPGGVAANVITYLSGGNVALAVSLTAISTLLSVPSPTDHAPVSLPKSSRASTLPGTGVGASGRSVLVGSGVRVGRRVRVGGIEVSVGGAGVSVSA